ncbi:MAG: YceI family protein [Planctomycetota bacterium]
MKSARFALPGIGAALVLGAAAAWSSAREAPVAIPAVAASAASVSGATLSAAERRSYQVDAGHTSVLFRVKHLNVANFWGRFNRVTGSYTVDPNDLASSSIEIWIDVETVDSNHDGRDRHLRSPDFFNTQQFPNATFESTSISKAGDDEFAVKGDMTIRGVTKPIEFTATWTGEGDQGPRFGYRSGWETEVTISRSEFGITYSPDTLGDEVKLVIAVEGIAQ